MLCLRPGQPHCRGIGRSMNMQTISKLTEDHLKEVSKVTRSKSHWRAMNLRALTKPVVWGCAVVMALASAAAVALGAVVSFGSYGAALLLEKVRPVRDAYQSLSQAYDQFIERLG